MYGLPSLILPSLLIAASWGFLPAGQLHAALIVSPAAVVLDDPEASQQVLVGGPADLTAVYHGFGVFLTNNTNRSTGELGHWPGTKLRRPEYLSEPMLGYALAHVAWFRDEDRPAWTKYLGWAFRQGLRYLQKTGDSTFQPVRLAQ